MPLPLLIMLLIEELLLLLLCPTMLPSTVQLLLDRPVDDWLLEGEGLWAASSSCPSMEPLLLLLLLVPNFSAAAYEVTAITFLMTGGGMLADALLPVRKACFFVVAGIGLLLLLLGGP